MKNLQDVLASLGIVLLWIGATAALYNGDVSGRPFYPYLGVGLAAIVLGCICISVAVGYSPKKEVIIRTEPKK